MGSARRDQIYMFRYDSDEDEWIEEQILEGDGEGGFGTAVDLGDDVLAVGTAFHDEGEEENSGRVIVYRYTEEDGWTEDEIITPSEPVEDAEFGFSVAVWEDQILVGQPGSLSQESSGRLFELRDGSYEEIQTLIGSETLLDDVLGRGVALEGDVALVADPYAFLNSRGAVYSFETCDEETDCNSDRRLDECAVVGLHQVLDPEVTGDNVKDQFGAAVSAHGAHILVGAPFDDADGLGAGTSWFFSWDGVEWVREPRPAPTGVAAEDEFGSAVGIHGHVAAVGAPGHDLGASDAGAIYMFEYDGGTWEETQVMLNASPGAGERLGSELSFDGQRLLAGSDADAAYVFEQVFGSWAEVAELIPDDQPSPDGFGSAVDLRGDMALVGAEDEDSGSAYVFRMADGAWEQEAELTPSEETDQAAFGSAVSIGEGLVVVGARGAGENQEGAAVVFELQDDSWVETGVLRGPDGGVGDEFGAAVTVIGEYIAVGAPFAGTFGFTSGSVYVFEQVGDEWQLLVELRALDSDRFRRMGGALAARGGLLVAGSPPTVAERRGSVSTFLFDAEGPVLTARPVSADVCDGSTVTLYSAAISNTSIEYQWSFEGEEISGATDPELTIEEFTEKDVGTYEVAVADGCGSATASATLGLLIDVDAPELDQQPAGDPACEGDTATLSAAATGTGPLTYQWFQDAVLLDGETAPTLEIDAQLNGAEAVYTLEVANVCGDTALSDGVSITVYDRPEILEQPADADVCEGDAVTLEIVADGKDLEYQWFLDDEELVEQTSATLEIEAASRETDHGDYLVVVSSTDGCTVVGEPFRLRVHRPPTIATQPQDAEAAVGNDAELEVVLDPGQFATYQWLKDGDPIEDATESTLTITPISLEDAGEYSVVITDNNDCSVLSAVAQLDVFVTFRRADVDGDGRCTLADALKMNSVALGNTTVSCDKSLDANDDSEIDIEDVIYTLVALFIEGPPPAEPFVACGEDPTEDAIECASYPSCLGD